ncbi:FmdB family zinc ribbon protein [Hydrogenophaga sp.]|uniref:FmdB family zinc ribbon protein n=1 Tax=Hydrogenophaga sp. TaxID=1904254 RepID=UPI002719C715|nr:FmdB family zinc ribbon protein [Hydrogenophaga sp.]MDO8903330.1 zinc ribbon domain-containing protein [Hydrogenophaga sp.]
MPIYAYKCESCGHAKDVLQKLSDDPLTVCPACGEPGFRKQLTAAGFQLKGSGWYVTDFREGSKAPAPPAAEGAAPAAAAAEPAAKGVGESTTAPVASPASAATAAAPAAVTKAPASPSSGSSPT